MYEEKETARHRKQTASMIYCFYWTIFENRESFG